MPLPNFVVKVPSNPINLPNPQTIDGGFEGTSTFLKSLQTFFGQNAAGHSSFAKAFEHVLGSEQATIIGHGIPGTLNTGQGNNFDTAEPGQYIGSDNGNDWRAAIDAVPDRRIKRLILFGCNVAAGATGAALLNQLAAKLTGTTIVAFDGLVEAQEGSNQPVVPVITKTVEVTAEQPLSIDMAPAPQRFLQPIAEAAPILWFGEGERFVDIGLEAVISVAVRFRDVLTRVEQWAWTRSPDTARRALRFVNFGTPLVFDGALGSGETGRFFLTVAGRRGASTREFRLLGNVLLEGLEVPSVFYEIDLPRFVAAVELTR